MDAKLSTPAEDYEDGANILEEGHVCPRSVFALRRLAEKERAKGRPKQASKHRTIKVRAGQGRGKSSEFTISRERLGE